MHGWCLAHETNLLHVFGLLILPHGVVLLVQGISHMCNSLKCICSRHQRKAKDIWGSIVHIVSACVKMPFPNIQTQSRPDPDMIE